jgi:hypothetical protein
MKLNISKEWCMRMADQEPGCAISAGRLAAMDPTAAAWQAFDDWLTENAERLDGLDILEKVDVYAKESAALASGDE